jgi:inorganic pyrophosphatase
MKIKLPPAYSKEKNAVNVVIETPSRSRNKFAFDEKTGMFKLKKVLPSGLRFPCEFGFIPGTEGGDGDPLDVMVFMDEMTFPGCFMECRLIGIIKGTQEEDGKEPFRNDRLIAVPVEMHDMQHISNLADLGRHKVDGLIHWMEYYNKMENKVYKFLEIGDQNSAMKYLSKNISN